MYQTANPHLQFHFARAAHGLVQAKCQVNYLDNGNENKTENKPKIAIGVTSHRPPIKEEEEEPKINDQATEKCSWGPGLPFL